MPSNKVTHTLNGIQMGIRLKNENNEGFKVTGKSLLYDGYCDNAAQYDRISCHVCHFTRQMETLNLDGKQK